MKDIKMKLLPSLFAMALFTLSAHVSAEIVHTPSFSIEKNQTVTENKAPESKEIMVKDKVKA